MKGLKAALVFGIAVVQGGCASGPFVASWTDPAAAPLQLDGAKVAAIVMIDDEAARRVAEDALVRELNARGANGVAMYTLMPGASPGNEAEVRATLEGLDFGGAVVMRPVEETTEIIATAPFYSYPPYTGLWGGYYGYGWADPWRVVVLGDVRSRTIVSVETLVYSLRQNKLVWGGQSRTTKPADVARLVRTTASQVSKELERLRLLPTA
jgi:hypothetical protein